MRSLKLVVTMAGVLCFANGFALDTKASKAEGNQKINNSSAKTTTSSAKSDNSTSQLSKEAKISYIIGANLGVNAKRQSLQIDLDKLIQGFKDAAQGNKLLMTEQDMRATWEAYQQQQMAKFAHEFQELAQKNKSKGEAFLTANKAKSGVVALTSGLQYKIVTAGNGEKPSSNDMVTVEYTGRTVDGKIFDTTDKRGKPERFQVSSVIPGWTEVLQLMPAGSTWEVYIPSNLAYGERGVGGPIGPNETLIFTIHLISVEKQAVTKPENMNGATQPANSPASNGQAQEKGKGEQAVPQPDIDSSSSLPQQDNANGLNQEE